MRTGANLPAILLLMAVMAVADRAVAQTRTDDVGALRARVEDRFDVLPISDGIALRPKDPARGIRSIEITNGPIAVDGEPVTGSELRTRLGDDADLVIELSYLSQSERRALATAAPLPRSGGTADAPATPEPSDPPRRRFRRSGGNDDRVRIGGSVTVREGEVIDGDVVAIGGSARVDGVVRGGVVAVGGGVSLGPNASVDEEVVVVGGTLRRAPGSQVRGKISEIGLGAFDFDRFRWSGFPFWTGWGSLFGSAYALIGTLMRAAILCLFCALVVLMGQDYMERAGTRAAADPVKSWAVGFLAQLLFLPIMIVGSFLLAITIIGIPLLVLLIPVVLLTLAVVGLVGFAGVANYVGRFAAVKMHWQDTNPYFLTIVGTLILMAPVLLARLAGLGGGILFPMALGLGIIGLIVEYLAWTIGFGAVALMRLQRPQSTPMVITPPVQA